MIKCSIMEIPHKTSKGARQFDMPAQDPLHGPPVKNLWSIPGLGNVRPAGHIRPAKHLNVAHELYSKFPK